MKVIWSSREWAEAVALLPAPGPLPSRTVLVPRERVAHSLRRELIRMGKESLLTGTRFISPLSAARDVLLEAGVDFQPGEEALRPARVLSIFNSKIRLQHFPLYLMLSRPGWDHSFARTITNIESAGLLPADLSFSGASKQLLDIAAVWKALEKSAGRSWTSPRILAEAAEHLEQNPRLWPFTGGVIACAWTDVTAVQARFLQSIPGAEILLLASRPQRESYIDRIAALFGPEAGKALREETAPRIRGGDIPSPWDAYLDRP